MSFKSQIVAGQAWIAGATFLGLIVTWGITIIVMRILSPADYGLLAMVSLFVAFLSLMSTSSLGAAVQDVSRRGRTLALVELLEQGRVTETPTITAAQHAPGRGR